MHSPRIPFQFTTKQSCECIALWDLSVYELGINMRSQFGNKYAIAVWERICDRNLGINMLRPVGFEYVAIAIWEFVSDRDLGIDRRSQFGN
jgi:hypothetical protein